METLRKRARAIGAVLVAIVCCAVWPLVAGLIGGAAVGSEWGEGAFAIVMLITIGVVWWRISRVRARRACAAETAATKVGSRTGVRGG
jgi:hypothetical protein